MTKKIYTNIGSQTLLIKTKTEFKAIYRKSNQFQTLKKRQYPLAAPLASKHILGQLLSKLLNKLHELRRDKLRLLSRTSISRATNSMRIGSHSPDLEDLDLTHLTEMVFMEVKVVMEDISDIIATVIKTVTVIVDILFKEVMVTTVARADMVAIATADMETILVTEVKAAKVITVSMTSMIIMVTKANMEVIATVVTVMEVTLDMETILVTVTVMVTVTTVVMETKATKVITVNTVIMQVMEVTAAMGATVTMISITSKRMYSMISNPTATVMVTVTGMVTGMVTVMVTRRRTFHTLTNPAIYTLSILVGMALLMKTESRILMKKKELLTLTPFKTSTTSILSGKHLTTTLIPRLCTLMPPPSLTMIILSLSKITLMEKAQMPLNINILITPLIIHMKRKMTTKVVMTMAMATSQKTLNSKNHLSNILTGTIQASYGKRWENWKK